MAKIEFEGFVNEHVGNPAFVLKVSENHRRKNDQGEYENAGRTFFDVKVPRDSKITLGQIPVDTRIKVVGRQVTEVREHEGKKFYTLTVWADRIEPAQASQQPQQAQGVANGQGQPQWGQPAVNGAPGAFQDEGFGQPF